MRPASQIQPHKLKLMLMRMLLVKSWVENKLKLN
jgi:hypothetical protein